MTNGNKTKVMYHCDTTNPNRDGINLIVIETNTIPPLVRGTFPYEYKDKLPLEMRTFSQYMVVSKKDAHRLFDFYRGSIRDVVHAEDVEQGRGE